MLGYTLQVKDRSFIQPRLKICSWCVLWNGCTVMWCLQACLLVNIEMHQLKGSCEDETLDIPSGDSFHSSMTSGQTVVGHQPVKSWNNKPTSTLQPNILYDSLSFNAVWYKYRVLYYHMSPSRSTGWHLCFPPATRFLSLDIIMGLDSWDRWSPTSKCCWTMAGVEPGKSWGFAALGHQARTRAPSAIPM